VKWLTANQDGRTRRIGDAGSNKVSQLKVEGTHAGSSCNGPKIRHHGPSGGQQLGGTGLRNKRGWHGQAAERVAELKFHDDGKTWTERRFRTRWLARPMRASCFQGMERRGRRDFSRRSTDERNEGGGGGGWCNILAMTNIKKSGNDMDYYNTSTNLVGHFQSQSSHGKLTRTGSVPQCVVYFCKASCALAALTAADELRGHKRPLTRMLPRPRPRMKSRRGMRVGPAGRNCRLASGTGQGRRRDLLRINVPLHGHAGEGSQMAPSMVGGKVDQDSATVLGSEVNGVSDDDLCFH